MTIEIYLSNLKARVNFERQLRELVGDIPRKIGRNFIMFSQSSIKVVFKSSNGSQSYLGNRPDYFLTDKSLVYDYLCQHGSKPLDTIDDVVTLIKERTDVN